jgi:hypothetical protein
MIIAARSPGGIWPLLSTRCSSTQMLALGYCGSVRQIAAVRLALVSPPPP